MTVFRPLLVFCLATGNAPAEQQSFSTEQLEFFEREVRPLLVKHCCQCHSADADRVEGGLLLDSRAAHLSGGDSGPSLVPGDPDNSLLIEAVQFESYEMPPKGKMDDKDINSLVRWVEMGAPWPNEAAPVSAAPANGFDLAQRKSEFWVWQPIANPEPPSVKQTDWPSNAIDHFTLARLEQSGLAPAGDADRLAILRRLSFGLTGLPPTLEAIDAFLADTSPQAIERVVDRLLDSPHFGERWGRHWLDSVRYAESRGHEFDNDIPNAFQYRDYVIRALNADVPYDAFVREHIAGDLIKQPRLHPTEKFNESVLGTGFWYLGEWVHSPVDIRKDEADRFDNMIDVMSKTFLGVTVACARCHDHKFDAISTADYYALSGYLQSSDYRQVRFESLEQNRQVANQLANLDARYQTLILERLKKAGLQPPSQVSYLTDESVLFDYSRMPQSQYLQEGYVYGPSARQQGLAYMDAKTGEVTVETGGWSTNAPFGMASNRSRKGLSETKTPWRNSPKAVGRCVHQPLNSKTAESAVWSRARGTWSLV